jgi:hypothetical protein
MGNKQKQLNYKAAIDTIPDSWSTPAANAVTVKTDSKYIARTALFLPITYRQIHIVADIELIDMKDIHAAFDRMSKGDVKYRFVIDMATL